MNDYQPYLAPCNAREAGLTCSDCGAAILSKDFIVDTEDGQVLHSDCLDQLIEDAHANLQHSEA